MPPPFTTILRLTNKFRWITLWITLWITVDNSISTVDKRRISRNYVTYMHELRTGAGQSYPLIHRAQPLPLFDFARKIRYTLGTRDLGEQIFNHARRMLSNVCAKMCYNHFAAVNCKSK